MPALPDHQTIRFWLIRHAPVIPGPSGFPDAQGEPDLSGTRALKRLAETLPRDALWIASPWPRARQTAETLCVLNGQSPAAVTLDPRFTEQNFGLWSGQSHDQAAHSDPDLYQRFWKDPAQTIPPEGESFALQTNRIKDALHSLIARPFAESNPALKAPAKKRQKQPSPQGRTGMTDCQPPAINMIIVTHAGTIRAALAVALECAPHSALHFHLDCLSLTCLEHWSGDTATPTDKPETDWKVALVNHHIPSPISCSPGVAGPEMTLVFGGIRSGKSIHAESLALRATGKDQTPIYIATADPELSATDQQMRDRIDHHRQRRGDRWRLIEEPDHLPACLRALAADQHAAGLPPILIDSMALWLANRMTKSTAIEWEVDQVCQALTRLPGPVILVSDEVGLGGVAAHPAARDFADQVGFLNSRLAELCDQVILVTAGLAMPLKT